MASTHASHPESLLVQSASQAVVWAQGLGQVFKRVALFEVENTTARVGAVFGIPEECIGRSMSLIEQTPLRWAVEAASPIVSAGRSPGGPHMAETLGIETPRAFAVLPIVIKRKLVALAYADQDRDPLPLRTAGELFAYCDRMLQEQVDSTNPLEPTSTDSPALAVPPKQAFRSTARRPPPRNRRPFYTQDRRVTYLLDTESPSVSVPSSALTPEPQQQRNPRNVLPTLELPEALLAPENAVRALAATESPKPLAPLPVHTAAEQPAEAMVVEEWATTRLLDQPEIHNPVPTPPESPVFSEAASEPLAGLAQTRPQALAPGILEDGLARSLAATAPQPVENAHAIHKELEPAEAHTEWDEQAFTLALSIAAEPPDGEFFQPAPQRLSADVSQAPQEVLAIHTADELPELQAELLEDIHLFEQASEPAPHTTPVVASPTVVPDALAQEAAPPPFADEAVATLLDTAVAKPHAPADLPPPASAVAPRMTAASAPAAEAGLVRTDEKRSETPLGPPLTLLSPPGTGLDLEEALHEIDAALVQTMLEPTEAFDPSQPLDFESHEPAAGHAPTALLAVVPPPEIPHLEPLALSIPAAESPPTPAPASRHPLLEEFFEADSPAERGPSVPKDGVVTPQGVVSLTELHRQPPRRTGLLPRVALSLLAALCLATAALVWTVAPPTLLNQSIPQTVQLDIPPHATVPMIARQLEGAKLVQNAMAFQALARATQKDRALKAGSYTIPTGLWAWEVLDELGRGQIRPVSITLPEGLSLAEVASEFEVAGLAKASDILEAAQDHRLLVKYGVGAPSLEGYLFPETYTFAQGLSAREMVEVMVQELFRRLRKIPGALALSPDALLDMVTLASIIEREAMVKAEMPRISGVFHNRINNSMRLESCATVQYILGKPKERLTVDDVRTPSPYNTYLQKGLPPGPIANPGFDALTAAMHPEQHGFHFFVAKEDGTGTHIFSKDYEAHQAAQKNIRTRTK